jgi:cytochrome c oxidase subunit IV
MSEHVVVPVWKYALIFGTLLLFTFITVEASRHDFGEWNTIIALTIAVFKATLVVLFFMHLRYVEHLTWIVVLSAIMMLAILLMLTLSDYLARGWLHLPGH